LRFPEPWLSLSSLGLPQSDAFSCSGGAHHSARAVFAQPCNSTTIVTVADIPTILARLSTAKDGSFAAFMLGPPFSQQTDAINPQYSVEHGTVGLDWVLLSPANVADRDKVSAFAAELGHPMSERVMNKVNYLRTEGDALDRLGTSIIVELYGMPRTADLEFIPGGFEWPPKT
jgi:hypothetical protein